MFSRRTLPVMIGVLFLSAVTVMGQDTSKGPAELPPSHVVSTDIPVNLDGAQEGSPRAVPLSSNKRLNAAARIVPVISALLLAEPESHKLTITRIGAGQGQVHVSPSGDSFPPGSSLTLSAEADLGSVFSGWGGACSGGELTCQLVMNKPETVTAAFSMESTVPRANQAVLGPLAGASIRAYTLSNLSDPVEGPFLANNSVDLDAAGTFDLSLTGIPDDQWILVTATGGWDIDADDDGVIDQAPTRNHGTIHALARASQWRQGGLKINALTDIAWRYARAWVGGASLAALEERLDEIARILLLEKLSGEGKIDYTDLLTFVPSLPAHKEKLSFEYNLFLAFGGFAVQVRAGAGDDALAFVLDLAFGAHLRFALPDHLQSEVQVRLTAFGRGLAESEDGNLLADSEAGPSAQKPHASYPRDGDPVLFTATPLPETEILAWSGCDWVSEDLTECRVGLHENRHVQVDFGYTESVTDPQFVDLSLATVIWTDDVLDVEVDEQDTELLALMPLVAADWFVAGLSDRGPFLLRVTWSTSTGDRRWELTTVQASLEEVILQGSGTLSRSMTHGDLEPDAYETYTLSKTGERLPVRLLPSKDPDDRVFRLRIGDVADPDDRSTHYAGELIIEEGDASISVRGEVDVLIDVETGISYGIIRGLEYFKFIPVVTVTPGISFSCSGSATLLERKEKIKTLTFTSIKFMAGPVPVWITPTVDIYIGVEGGYEASASFGITYNATVRAGVQYTSTAGWEPVSSFEREWDVSEPEVNGSASIKGFLAAEPSMMIYSLTGPGVGIEAFLRGAATLGLDPSCIVALDWALWGGFEVSLKWKGNESIPLLGSALQGLNLTHEFPPWERKILGGVLNACGAEPPVLVVQGQDIVRTIVQGSSEDLTTTYTLTNSGNQTLPWSIEWPAWSPVSVEPVSGNLAPGASVLVAVAVQGTAALSRGVHTYRLDFKNNFQGPIGQSGLGSVDRYVRVTVVDEDFPAPTLTSAQRYTATSVRLQWTYPEASRHLLAGFDIWYTLDPGLGGGWVKAYTADRTQRSITLQNLPSQTLYVTVEAFGANPALQTAQSEVSTVPALGSQPPIGAMAQIPAGCFMMGDHLDGMTNALPVHNVCISAFEMDVYEVTNAQYAACVAAGGCTAPASTSSNTRASYYGNLEYASYPVIYMNWHEATAYCAWAGKRLPTEAEWEYAARGGMEGRRYPWGNTISGTDANYWDSGDPWDNDTSPVGYYAPNGYGLYDMAGNVWEWVSDWYSGTYYQYCVDNGIVNDPPGPVSGTTRGSRGGAWYNHQGLDNMRVAFRGTPEYPGVRYSNVGLRCAR